MRALLDATDLVVRAQGATAVSIAVIAERAGIAQGSVYQYFPTKAAVLAAWEEREWGRISQEIASEVASLVGQEPRPTLDAAVRHVTAFATERIARQARVYAESGFPDFVSRPDERKKILDTAVEVIAMGLAAARERPGVGARLRVADPKRAAHVCVRLVMTMAPLGGMKGLTDDERRRMAQDVVDLVMAFLFGVAPPPEEGAGA